MRRRGVGVGAVKRKEQNAKVSRMRPPSTGTTYVVLLDS